MHSSTPTATMIIFSDKFFSSQRYFIFFPSDCMLEFCFFPLIKFLYAFFLFFSVIGVFDWMLEDWFFLDSGCMFLESCSYYFRVRFWGVGLFLGDSGLLFCLLVHVLKISVFVFVVWWLCLLVCFVDYAKVLISYVAYKAL